ncbi:helix-turn-helix domain-containing protein [Actinophytocola sediminis]
MRTPKARALGGALRQAREEKGLLLRELGVAISKDNGVISRWETGARTPKPEQVAQILSTLGVTGDRYDEIMTLAYGTNESQWVATTLPEQKQQMVAYVDWEQNASRIVEVAPLLVPGILQTGDYVRAIMTAPGVPVGEVASRVTTRIGRREVITRQQPAELLVLLGRAALNQGIGGRQVMIGQLAHLLEMATRPNVDLRIVPDDAGWHPGLEGAFALIEKKSPPVTDSIVFVETRRSELILHEPGDVNAYQWAVDQIIKVSLPPEMSVSYIADLRTRMEKRRGKSSRLAQVEP